MKLNLSKKTLSIVSTILILQGTAAAVLLSGNENYSEPTVSKSSRTIYDEYPDIKQIETWESATLAVASTSHGDELYAWGKNTNGVLTDAQGMEQDKTYGAPMKITPEEWTGKEIKDATISSNSAAAIVSTTIGGEEVDQLYTWGNNVNGLLANGEATEEVVMTPTLVTYPGTEDWILNDVETTQNTMAISITEKGTLGKETDHLYTWGSNSYGALGVNDSKLHYTATPMEVVFADNDGSWKIKQMDGGTNDAFMVSFETSGNDVLYAWGHNSNYALGIGGSGGAYWGPHIVNQFAANVDFEIVTVKDFDFDAANVGLVVNDGVNDHLLISGSTAKGMIPGAPGPNESKFWEVFETTSPEEEIVSVAFGKWYYHVVYNDGTGNKLYGKGEDYNLRNLGYDYNSNGYEIENSNGISITQTEYVRTALPDNFQYMFMSTYQNHTFVVGKEDSFTKVYAFGCGSDEVLGIPKRSYDSTTPSVMDFTYKIDEVKPDTFITRFGTANFVMLIVFSITWLLLIIGLILFILHKVHHKEHIEAIEEHGKTLTGEKNEN